MSGAIKILAEPAIEVCKEKLEATAIKRILDIKSGEVVGWVYEWNTGDRKPMWKNAKCEDVIYD